VFLLVCLCISVCHSVGSSRLISSIEVDTTSKNFLQEKAVEATKQEKERKEEKT
jgi:hypothetical protein